MSRYAAIPRESQEREGLRVTHGWISVADYPALIALHDSYHISQAEEYTELALRALHTAYGLDAA